LEVLAGHIQLDVQQAAAKVAAEVPYETAHTLFTDLTGVPVSTERLHTLTNRIAEGLGVLEVAPTAEEIASTVAALAQGRQRRPIMVLACDGAHVPTRPETARGRRRGRKRQRARRCRWTGHYREAKGMRGSLVEGERIVHLFSWHQVQDTPSLVKALQQVQQAGLIPEDTVRLCVIADGARWIWDHVAPLFPQAHHILDYDHCAQYLHAFAALYSSEGATFKGQEWGEATLARLYCGEVHPVLESLRRLRPTTPVAVTALTNLRTYLSEHRRHLNYRAKRRAGYPIGSGGIESANKFLCHVRLKRSGAWWYTTNSNQMLALRCAKYNGTFERVVARYQQRQLRAKK
jgi:hypothetical protein